MPKVKLVLETKLQPPQLKGRILRRDRLLDMLYENLEKKLIVICADAGYGKTTLLAQFCKELNKPYVFYDLDSKDNDITTFFTYLVAGIARHAPRFGDRVLDVIPQTKNIEIIVGTFINEFIESASEDFFIILDDYHYIQHNRKIAAILDYLLRHLPVNLHFIISSRTTPLLNLPYYLAKQELLKIGKHDLRFTSSEIRVLVEVIYGLRIPTAEIARIAELSEGWITVLHLMVQKISSGVSSVQETINGYLASDEEIFNYFAREVFENQPQTIRDFLLKTSIVEYMNPKICKQLLGSKNAMTFIAHLEAEHIFISKVGNNIKYHHVFQDYLQNRLKQVCTSKEIRILHNNTARYFLNANDYTLAVRHFLAAENYKDVATILSRNYHYWMTQGDFKTFVQLVELVPTSVLENHPNLMLKKSFALIGLDKLTQALEIIEATLRKFRQKNDMSGIVESLVLKAQVYFAQMQPHKALYYLKVAFTITSRTNNRSKADILMKIGSVYRELGLFNKAKTALEQALRIIRKFRNKQLEESCLRRLALLHYAMGNFKQADELFQNIFSQFGEQPKNLSLAYMYSTVASLAIDDGNIEKAHEYLDRTEGIVKQYNDQWLSDYIVYQRARIHAFNNDCVRAAELYEKVLEPHKKTKPDGYKVNITTDLIDAYIRIGSISRARDTLKSIEPHRTIIQESPLIYIGYLVVRGKLETSEGKYSSARQSFTTGLALARKMHHPYMMMLLYHELSTCYLKSDEIDSAVDCLKKWLTLAQEHGYDACVIREGRENLELLTLALEHAIMPDYVVHILGKIDSDEARSIRNRLLIKKGTYDIECRLFGNLEIRNAQGRVIKPRWRTHKTMILFILLTTNRHKGYTRDQLINTIWPRKGMREAAHSLQVEISSVRKLLKEFVPSELSAKHLVVYKQQSYYLNTHLKVKTDVQEFDDLIRNAEARAEKSKSRDLYLRAWKLYRGDFCSDCADEWCEETRQYYRNVVVKVLKKLGASYNEEQDYEKSLEMYKEAYAINLYDEDVHIGIMRSYAGLGDRDHVQAQYKLLIKTLKKLGVEEPPRQATQIYQKSLT